MGKDEVVKYVKVVRARRPLPEELLASLLGCNTKSEAKRKVKAYLREVKL